MAQFVADNHRDSAVVQRPVNTTRCTTHSPHRRCHLTTHLEFIDRTHAKNYTQAVSVHATHPHWTSTTIPVRLWLGSRVVSVLDSGAEKPGFKSQPRRCRLTVLGKLFTPIVPLFTEPPSHRELQIAFLWKNVFWTTTVPLFTLFSAFFYAKSVT